MKEVSASLYSWHSIKSLFCFGLFSVLSMSTSFLCCFEGIPSVYKRYAFRKAEWIYDWMKDMLCMYMYLMCLVQRPDEPFFFFFLFSENVRFLVNWLYSVASTIIYTHSRLSLLYGFCCETESWASTGTESRYLFVSFPWRMKYISVIKLLTHDNKKSNNILQKQ